MFECLISIILLLFVLFCRNTTKNDYVCYGGNTTLQPDRILGPKYLVYYKNFLGKELYMFGEWHGECAKENTCMKDNTSQKYITVWYLVYLMLKNPKSGLILERDKYRTPDCDIIDSSVVFGNSIPVNKLTLLSMENPNVILGDIRRSLIYGRICILSNVNNKNKNIISNDLSDITDWFISFIKKYENINDMIKVIINAYKSTKMFKSLYKKISKKDRDIVDELLDDILVKDYDRLNTTYQSMRENININNISSICCDISMNVMVPIADIVTLMNMLVCSWNRIILYWGVVHIQNIQRFLDKKYNIKPTHIWKKSPPNDYGCLITNGLKIK